ncbi:unnamed protein product [Caretta caretta]
MAEFGKVDWQSFINFFLQRYFNLSCLFHMLPSSLQVVEWETYSETLPCYCQKNPVVLKAWSLGHASDSPGSSGCKSCIWTLSSWQLEFATLDGIGVLAAGARGNMAH